MIHQMKSDKLYSICRGQKNKPPEASGEEVIKLRNFIKEYGLAIVVSAATTIAVHLWLGW